MREAEDTQHRPRWTTRLCWMAGAISRTRFNFRRCMPREASPLSQSRMKRCAFRLAAVLVGLLPLVVCEGAFRLLDWGRPSRFDDPFVGFSAVHPLFVLSDDKTRYEIAKGRLTHFRPDSFAVVKPANEFRIFVLGGSTVQGRPYAIETSFTAWLELSLQAADPSRKFEVVNCGGVSYATYRLVPILEEVLAYQPDLIIYYEGHNEFLEDRTYEKIKHTPAFIAWPHEQLSRLRTYTLLRAAILPPLSKGGPGGVTPQTNADSTGSKPTLAPEVDARLDWRGGMEHYHRNETWHRDVIAHFEFNLRRAVAIAQNVSVPLVLVNPVSNLDWAPFKVEHKPGMTAAERDAFDKLVQSARDAQNRDPREAIPLWQQALAVDDGHAGAHYELGKCYQSLGQFAEARKELLKAKDADVCPLRILQPMNETVLRVARETATPLVDAESLFTSRSRGGIPGDELLVDHVHPSIDGHQLLANAIADELVELSVVRPIASWATDRDRKYREHLASLDHLYFLHGQQRLRNEQGWAHGRADREPQKSPPLSKGG